MKKKKNRKEVFKKLQNLGKNNNNNNNNKKLEEKFLINIKIKLKIIIKNFLINIKLK